MELLNLTILECKFTSPFINPIFSPYNKSNHSGKITDYEVLYVRAVV